MSNIKFTIVTITYNSSKYVKQTIESVLSQSYGNFDYIISDDCSTDHTWDIIQSYNDPRIRAFRNISNIGEYPNRNKTLFQANGDYIMWVDGDDILFKDTLSNLFKLITFFPSSGMVWGIPHLQAKFFVTPYEFTPEETLSIIYRNVLPGAHIGFSETLFKTQILKELGGFSTNYKIGDVFIKKRMACYTNTLMIPLGMSFWREHTNQASKKALVGARNFIDSILIDSEIRSIINTNPNFGINFINKLSKNIKIRQIKSLFVNTIIRRRFLLFFKLYKRLDLSIFDLLLYFKKAESNFQFNRNGENPFINKYNFSK